jgi:RNA ligase
VISRPFHKFFNLNEKEETRNVDWTEPHHVLNKLDGSMVRPIPLASGIRWGTKMGVTDVALLCEAFVSQHRRYESFAAMCVDRGTTPIFEYVSPGNRIVLEYDQEDCVLLAIRDNKTGRYLSVDSMNMVANQYDMPVVQPVKNSLDTISQLVNTEGVVVRFDSGHMIKIKSEWYVMIHRAKENLLFEKNVIRMILEDRVDDLLPNLPESDVRRLEDYKENLLTNIDDKVSVWKTLLEFSHDLGKKHFALEVAPKLPSFARIAIFAAWDRPEQLRDIVIANILKKCGSQNDVDSIRDIIGGSW